MQSSHVPKSLLGKGHQDQDCLSVPALVRPPAMGSDDLEVIHDIQAEAGLSGRDADGGARLRGFVTGCHPRAAESAQLKYCDAKCCRCYCQQVAVTGKMQSSVTSESR